MAVGTRAEGQGWRQAWRRAAGARARVTGQAGRGAAGTRTSRTKCQMLPACDSCTSNVTPRNGAPAIPNRAAAHTPCQKWPQYLSGASVRRRALEHGRLDAPPVLQRAARRVTPNGRLRLQPCSAATHAARAACEHARSRLLRHTPWPRHGGRGGGHRSKGGGRGTHLAHVARALRKGARALPLAHVRGRQHVERRQLPHERAAHLLRRRLRPCRSCLRHGPLRLRRPLRLRQRRHAVHAQPQVGACPNRRHPCPCLQCQEWACQGRAHACVLKTDRTAGRKTSSATHRLHQTPIRTAYARDPALCTTRHHPHHPRHHPHHPLNLLNLLNRQLHPTRPLLFNGPASPPLQVSAASSTLAHPRPQANVMPCAVLTWKAGMTSHPTAAVNT